MIATEIQNFFSFIDFLHSNTENFKQYDEQLKEIKSLDKHRKRLDVNANYKAKQEYDKIQKELETRFDLVQAGVLKPIKEKAIELNVCDFTKEPIYNWNGVQSKILALKSDFTDDDVSKILTYKNKYSEFKKEFTCEIFDSFFWDDLNKILQELFDYFSESEQEPEKVKFEDFIKQYDEQDVQNNFENIVKKFQDKEKLEKPLNWKFSTPTRLGANLNMGFIRSITIDEFKTELLKRLNEPFAEKKTVIENFRKDYILNALQIDKVKTIYNTLKAGKMEQIYFSNIIDKWLHYDRKINVMELIKLEKYLNEFEKNDHNTNQTSVTNNPDEVKKELHTHIFKNNAFAVWMSMYNSFGITEKSRTDVKFMFEEMKKDDLIHNSVNQTTFLDWISETHQITVQRTSNYSKTKERISIYSTAKQLYKS